MRRRYLQLIAAVPIAVIALTPALIIGQQSPRQIFERAKIVEEANTDLMQAIHLYEQVVAQSKDRVLTAEALLHIGGSYEKLGSAESRKAYERVALEFADQKAVAADAGRRLAVLNIPLNLNQPTTRLVLAGDSVDSDASLSPDGRWMAMSDWSSKDGHLVVRDMSTGQVKRLQTATCHIGSNDCTFAEKAVFSPDTRQVAFIWYDDLEIDGHPQLRVIANEVGAKPRVLVRSLENNVWPAAWSHDGKSILGTIRKSDLTWQIGWVSVTDGSIKVIKSLGWRSPQNLSLSADGRYIAYSALAINPSKAPPAFPESTDRHIYSLAADGSSETELVKSASINERPVWTLDGAYVLFTSQIIGTTDLWAIAAQDGKAAGDAFVVRREIGAISPIGMTLSGSLYYAQRKGGVEQISIAELSTASGNHIEQSFVGVNPSWSPDGKSLGFKRHSTRFKDFYDVVVHSLETGEERVFSRNGMRGDPPRWLRDNTGFLTLVGIDASTLASWNRVELKNGEFTQPGQLGSIRARGHRCCSRQQDALCQCARSSQQVQRLGSNSGRRFRDGSGEGGFHVLWSRGDSSTTRRHCDCVKPRRTYARHGNRESQIA